MISSRLRSHDKKIPVEIQQSETKRSEIEIVPKSKKRKADLGEASSSKRKQKREKEEEQDDGSGGSAVPIVEKRLKSYRAKCPPTLLQRMSRARTQRMYCLEQHQTGPYSREYDVLGSTGNVYRVNIGKIHSCDCPDHPGANNHCKHILFVLMKVLKAKKEYVYQAALLSKELEEIFASNPELSAMASKDLLDIYKSMQKGETLPETKELQKELSDCPICFEECTEADRDKCVICGVCSNNIHKECFKVWVDTKKAKHEVVTCVYCRSEWSDKNSSVTKLANDEGYINLGAEAGLPVDRDSTTYDPYLSRSWQH